MLGSELGILLVIVWDDSFILLSKEHLLGFPIQGGSLTLKEARSHIQRNE